MIHLYLLKGATELTKSVPKLEGVIGVIFSVHQNVFVELRQIVHAIAYSFIGGHVFDLRFRADCLDSLPDRPIGSSVPPVKPYLVSNNFLNFRRYCLSAFFATPLFAKQTYWAYLYIEKFTHLVIALNTQGACLGSLLD
ncbi:hypothetical protein D3C77_349380 [compost metagenome]